MALSKPLKSPLTHSATSITSSWLISYFKPVVQLVIHKIPRSFKPEQATTITSGAVDIPTTSVPSILQVRISTRVQIRTRALPFFLYIQDSDREQSKNRKLTTHRRCQTVYLFYIVLRPYSVQQIRFTHPFFLNFDYIEEIRPDSIQTRTPLLF